MNRIRQERARFDASSGGKKPKLEYLNIKEPILHTVGYRVSHQLLLPPALKVCAMASNLVHGAAVVNLKTREIKKDSKTGAVPVKADLNILYTGSQDEYWLNLSEDRKFKQEKMDSHGMVITGISLAVTWAFLTSSLDCCYLGEDMNPERVHDSYGF